MQLIIEGCDGTCKSTLSFILASKNKCDLVRLIENGSKEFIDYLTKCLLHNVVHDRSFISEVVYSKVYGYKCALSEKEIDILINNMKDEAIAAVILDCESKIICERLKMRGDEQEKVFKNIEKIRKEYLKFAKKYGIKVIDTTN